MQTILPSLTSFDFQGVMAQPGHDQREYWRDAQKDPQWEHEICRVIYALLMESYEKNITGNQSIAATAWPLSLSLRRCLCLAVVVTVVTTIPVVTTSSSSLSRLWLPHGRGRHFVVLVVVTILVAPFVSITVLRFKMVWKEKGRKLICEAKCVGQRWGVRADAMGGGDKTQEESHVGREDLFNGGCQRFKLFPNK
ncbi:hypothetical protein EDB89DRAFT_1911905 [Lactarius sanguifluus]|nr:hypothetical protein EDB89DRAFT_1911905 [Lactarius sanguifluus]